MRVSKSKNIETVVRKQSMQRKRVDVLNLRLELRGKELIEFLEVKHHMHEKYATEVLRSLIASYHAEYIFKPRLAMRQKKAGSKKHRNS